MRSRKFSFLFFLFSILAGLVGFFIGEYLLAQLEGTLPNLVLMGIYFAQLALWIGLFCLLAEIFSPTINGRSWRLQYSGTSWKVLVSATAGLLFVGGLVFQFIYEFTLSKVKPPDDIVLVMDISESMIDTDPTGESLLAAKEFLGKMDDDHRAAIITFNNETYITQPMFDLKNMKDKENAFLQIDSLTPYGGTDIGLALKKSMEHLNGEKVVGRKPMVILFSDGYSDFDMDGALQEYKEGKVMIHTIGMSRIDFEGASTLKKIASETGGLFYDVTEANQLANVFEDIYFNDHDRHLVGERTGYFSQHLYLSILRVLFITFIGGLIGLSLGVIFDNRYLAKSYIVGGGISGILAGLILEIGLQDTLFAHGVYRAIADIILGLVVGLGTLIIPVKEKYSSIDSSSRSFDRLSAKTFDTKPPIKKGFS